MKGRETKLYRCHSTHDFYLYVFSHIYRYIVNHAKNNIIFPVLSVIFYILFHLIHIIGSFGCHSRNKTIAYPGRGNPPRSPSARGEGDRMSGKRITSTSTSIGKEEYKGLLPKGAESKNLWEISNHVVRKIKSKVYPFLELPARHNLQWTSEKILDLVLIAGKRYACLEDTSISLNFRKPRVVRGIAMPSVPNAKTVFRRIKEVSTEEWMRRFEEANRRLLETATKSRMFKGWVDLAVDIHDIPFYGNKNTPGVVGTQRKLGTSWAFRYMTVCATALRDKYTLSAKPMTQLSSKSKTLKELLQKAIQYIDGHIGCVYLDRGFFNVACIYVLLELELKFLMPAVKNAKIKRIIKETKEFPAIMPYTMKKDDKTVDFTLVLLQDEKGDVKAFATNLNVDKSQAEKLFDLYGNRWTVETSYRMLGEVRTKTTTKNYAVRWFFVLFGLLIRNGYYLFNAVISKIGHFTLITFAEIFSEVSGALFKAEVTKRGNG